MGCGPEAAEDPNESRKESTDCPSHPAHCCSNLFVQSMPCRVSFENFYNLLVSHYACKTCVATLYVKL